MEKTDVAFDQFQRYETISRIVEHYRANPGETFQILELGANEHKDLKLFLPDDQILFTDIQLTETMRSDPDFQEADATDLPFANQSFDFVVAADVFEHVAPEKRNDFLRESYRVAKKGAILSFPYDGMGVSDTEKRVNAFYKSLAGTDFIWLKEHIDNGLPEITLVEAALNKIGCPYISFFHGNLQTWEKMWYCHFKTVFTPETLEYRQTIDRYYNTVLYLSDVSDTCYRAFFCLLREKYVGQESELIPRWKEPPGAETAKLDLLLGQHESLYPLIENKRLHDSLEASRQMERELQKAIEDKERHIGNLNGALAQRDEQLAQCDERLAQRDEQLAQRDEQLAQCGERLAESEAELAHYKEHYLAAIGQREALQRQLSESQYAYAVISHSACWRMTKPLRVILDLTKRMIRKIPPLFLLEKGLRCLKQNGFRYTWKRFVGKLRGNREYERIYQQQGNYIAGSHDGIGIKFSILVPLFNTPEKFLRELIQSVQMQEYSNWELCLADGSDAAHDYVEAVCREYADKDERILYKRLERNGGISENSNECAKMASGDYIALLDHDDLLAMNALSANVTAILETGADVLYSDEDHLSINGKHVSPFFKPDWSPDLLFSQMYICHFLVFRRSLFNDVGGFRSEFDGSQDYDLMLRISERTDRICHIPQILYHWRESESSTAAGGDAKPYAHEAGRKALDLHLKRVYGEETRACDGLYTFVYDARFAMCSTLKVSIIIPMRDKWELTDQCIHSIVEKSDYQNYEILVLDNRSEEAETLKWFDDISTYDTRVRIIPADMDFNWSAINNYGIRQSSGDVLIFLNNDTLVLSEDWIERLCENACREDIGVAGGLLLYPDDTIQHAGVVVGMGGWAEHVFKGMQPIHYGSPFISPMVSRNVMAVTGACMAISRQRLDEIGMFDEGFQICGSDVELCIRAYEKGYLNRYDARVVLRHLESKTRDTFIPEIDFTKSYELYGPYRNNVDPFFNINLDPQSVSPKVRMIAMNQINYDNFKRRLKELPVIRAAAVARKVLNSATDYRIPEIEPICCRSADRPTGLRLNLLIPSVDETHVFGGIATAIRFFEALRHACGCPARIIVVDAPVVAETSKAPEEYIVVPCGEDSKAELQIIPFSDRHGKTIPVTKNDVFLATGWWTAYTISKVLRWQEREYGRKNPLLYFVQDYEPGFYPWSSRYLLADSTYRLDVPTYAVINSAELNTFFKRHGYHFAKQCFFEPVLNPRLQTHLPSEQTISKKKRILVYGRPGTERNAFSLLVYALNEWAESQPDAAEWELCSVGEPHGDIALESGLTLKSLGKLSLDDYAEYLRDSYAGISLMVSPHPSYPPLEMAAFGVKTITNYFENKDLSGFSDNIISLSSCSPSNIARTLGELCGKYDAQGRIPDFGNRAYIGKLAEFEDIPEQLAKVLKYGDKEDEKLGMEAL